MLVNVTGRLDVAVDPSPVAARCSSLDVCSLVRSRDVSISGMSEAVYVQIANNKPCQLLKKTLKENSRTSLRQRNEVQTPPTVIPPNPGKDPNP